MRKYRLIHLKKTRGAIEQILRISLLTYFIFLCNIPLNVAFGDNSLNTDGSTVLSTAPSSIKDETESKDNPDRENSDPDDSDMDDPDDEFIDDEFDEFEEDFEEATVRVVSDPLILWNRAIFFLNDKLILWGLEPISKGYRVIFPRPVRVGLKNFFNNVITPLRLTNCLLQGKGNAAELEFARFLVNSTVGVLGFGDPASKFPKLAPPDDEDLGQTLGVWGIGPGFYIIWPFFGPSTLRDSIGFTGDIFLNPVRYVEPFELSLAISGVDSINSYSFYIGDYEAVKAAAIDPYQAVRDIYIQLRERKIQE